ncbi:MAG: hypothetical protein AB1631_31570 [Acidobacteriota bacterium]
MNLNAVTQAISGGIVVSDPVRDREYRRARKHISDGIQGSAIGVAFIIGAVVAYLIRPGDTYFYAVSLVLGLLGIIKLFRSIGSIIDAKVGQKLLDPELQPRGTGNLNPTQAAAPPSAPRPSQRLTVDPSRPVNNPPAPPTRPVTAERKAISPAQPRLSGEHPVLPGTGRINREQSTPLRNKVEKKDDDIISQLRN